MKGIFVSLADRIIVSQKFYDKTAFITFSDLSLEWWGFIIGKYETKPNPNNPIVPNVLINIDDVVIPKQDVTGGSVRVNTSAIAEVLTIDFINELNKNGQQIVGWVHSHAMMSPYLSSVDMSNIEEDMAMQPATISIVTSYSRNTEYQKKKDTDNSKTQKNNSTPDAASIQLDSFFGRGGSVNRSKYSSEKNEFHMGIWFSLITPFGDKKSTTDNIAASPEYSTVISWPERRTRQQKELLASMPKDMQQEMSEIRKQKIVGRPERIIERPISQHHTYIPHYQSQRGRPYPERYLESPSISHEPVSIVGCYSSAIRSQIKLTNPAPIHIPARIKVKSVKKSIKALEYNAVSRDNLCVFCNDYLDHQYPWGCDACDRVVDKFIIETGLEPNDLGMIDGDHWPPTELTELCPDPDMVDSIIREHYLEGDCMECVLILEHGLHCVECELTYGVLSIAQNVIEGCLCDDCESQLIYYFTLYDPWENDLGSYLKCPNCMNGFVLEIWGDLTPEAAWYAKYATNLQWDKTELFQENG